MWIQVPPLVQYDMDGEEHWMKKFKRFQRNLMRTC